MALSIVIGALIGILPLFGVAAFLIGILVVVLRLNLAITAFMAYAVTPLYLLLFVPFIRIGELIFGTEPTWMNFADIKASFQADYLVALQQLSFQLFCGVTGWFLVAVPMAALFYLLLWRIFAFYKESHSSSNLI